MSKFRKSVMSVAIAASTLAAAAIHEPAFAQSAQPQAETGQTAERDLSALSFN